VEVIDFIDAACVTRTRDPIITNIELAACREVQEALPAARTF
jgi:hypothetical protein